MRAATSLLRAWLSGFGAFITITAAFVLALSFAISGPPTAEEIGALSTAGAQFERASANMREAMCESAEDLLAALLACPRRARIAQSEPEPVAPPPRRVAADAAPTIEPSAAPAETELLGDANTPLAARIRAPDRRLAVREAPPRRIAQPPRRAPVALRRPVNVDALPDESRPTRFEEPRRAQSITPETTKATEPTRSSAHGATPEDEAHHWEEEEPYPDDEPYYPEDRYWPRRPIWW